MEPIRYYLPGIILILIALMIVVVPEILVAFVAAMVIMAGIVALFIGHKIRTSDTDDRQGDAWFSDEDLLGRRFVRRPISRDWHRWF